MKQAEDEMIRDNKAAILAEDASDTNAIMEEMVNLMHDKNEEDRNK